METDRKQDIKKITLWLNSYSKVQYKTVEYKLNYYLAEWQVYSLHLSVYQCCALKHSVKVSEGIAVSAAIFIQNRAAQCKLTSLGHESRPTTFRRLGTWTGDWACYSLSEGLIRSGKSLKEDSWTAPNPRGYKLHYKSKQADFTYDYDHAVKLIENLCPGLSLQPLHTQC